MAKVVSSIGEGGMPDGGRTWNVQDPREGQKDPFGFDIQDERAAPRFDVQDRRAVPQGRQIDPAEVQAMRERAMKSTEQQAYQEMQGARRRVDIITGIGRKTKDVPVPGSETIFTLRTLKFNEKKMVSQTIEQADREELTSGKVMITPSGIADIQREAIAHSLHLIDGQPVEMVLGCLHLHPKEQLQERRGLVGEMDGILIEHLYSKYEELTKEAYDGYRPQTASEAKEVVDTIKKSSPNE